MNHKEEMESNANQSILNYKNLSIIQTIAITIAGISLFDLGYGNTVFRGIWFNWLLFHSDPIPDKIIESGFWGEFQFIAFLLFIVAGCQLLKAIPIKQWNFEQIVRKTGLLAVIFLIVFPFLAIIISIDNFDFRNQTLSSLVDFGWQSTILISWGLMLGGILSIPFLLYLRTVINHKIVANLTLFSMVFTALLIFFIGLTLPTDQPWNHGLFASVYWNAISFTVILVSLSISSEFQYMKISGVFLGILLLIVLIIKEFILLPAYFQFLFTVFPVLWFIFVGKSIFETSTKETENNTSS